MARRIWFAVASILALTASLTSAAPVYLPDLPDFYQHQWSGSGAAGPYFEPGSAAGSPDGFFALPGGAGGAFANPTAASYTRTTPTANNGPGVQWEYDGGWCWSTAFTNVLYQLDHHGAAGLFTHAPGVGDPAAPTWLERMTYAIEDTSIKMFNLDGGGAKTMDGIISGWVGAGVVVHDVYTWNAGASLAQKNGVNTGSASMFDVYRSLIDAGQNVMIRIGGTPTAGAWWSGSYHQVTGAGYDVAGGNKVYYADPNNRGSGGASANWGFSYAAAAALPVGAAYYDMGTMNADGTFSGGAYAGSSFIQFDAFFVVPEPNTALLAIVGVGATFFLRLRRVNG